MPDIMELLRQLEGNQNPGELNKRGTGYATPPDNLNPGADPRAQAIQRYMEMQGAGSIPRGYSVPDAKKPGRTRKGTLQERYDTSADLLSEMEGDSPVDEADIESGRFFRERLPKRDDSDPGLASTMGDAPDDEEEESVREGMHLPSYIDRRGQPSPNKDFDTEGELDGVSKFIDTKEFDPDELKEAQRSLYESQTDSAMSKFIKQYGRKNLPDFTGNEYDTSPQGIEKNRMRESMPNSNELRGMPFEDLRRLYLFQKKGRGEPLTDEEEMQMMEPAFEPPPEPTPGPPPPPIQMRPYAPNPKNQYEDLYRTYRPKNDPYQDL